MRIEFDTDSLSPRDVFILQAIMAAVGNVTPSTPMHVVAESPQPAPTTYTPHIQAAPVVIETTPDPADIPAAPGTPVAAADAAGYPWDARIHSANKGMTADGNWRRRRNVADSMVAQVEAELRDRRTSHVVPMPPVPPAPVAAAPTNVAPPPVALPPSTPVFAPPPMAAPVQAPVAAPPTPPVAAAPGDDMSPLPETADFSQILRRNFQLQQAGKDTNAAIARVGIGQIGEALADGNKRVLIIHTFNAL